ncbi:sugar phosphate isomerase/epimerase family protein [Oceanobacillus damuensis]|uniref:sugar phosphate isomerase/epimerase family protein n=1 Tax=Oceanobacillus damuensis TaxID=937928 RepID=UPI0008300283|nr:sugar phosphate isomerase/epimerase family protein [Oceanobacillus damuensis]
MRFYMASTLCWSFHPLEAVAIAEEEGLQGVELWAEHIFYHHANPEEIRLLAEEKGLALTLHASSWDLNICSLNQGIREQSLAELKKSVDLAEVLQVEHMTFHPGRFTVKSYLQDEHRDLLVRNTKELVDYAKGKQVIISQELMEEIPKEMLTDPNTMNAFTSQVGEGLYVTLDIAHTPLSESSLAYMDKLERVNSIHLSDSNRDQFHVPLGKGAIDIPHVLNDLSETNLPVVLEGMDTGHELSFLKQHLSFLREAGWTERKTHA